MLCRKTSPWQHNLNQKASGKPGAVHHDLYLSITLHLSAESVKINVAELIEAVQEHFFGAVGSLAYTHSPCHLNSPARLARRYFSFHYDFVCL
jgi:hypothetical protein